MTHWLEVFRYEVRQQFRRKSYLFITFGVPILALVIFFGYQVYRDMTRGDERLPRLSPRSTRRRAPSAT